MAGGKAARFDPSDGLLLGTLKAARARGSSLRGVSPDAACSEPAGRTHAQIQGLGEVLISSISLQVSQRAAVEFQSQLSLALKREETRRFEDSMNPRRGTRRGSHIRSHGWEWEGLVSSQL